MSNDNFERSMKSLRQSQVRLEAVCARIKKQAKEVEEEAASLVKFSQKVEAQRKNVEEGRKGGG